MLETLLPKGKTGEIRLMHVKPKSLNADKVAKAETIDYAGIR